MNAMQDSILLLFYILNINIAKAFEEIKTNILFDHSPSVFNFLFKEALMVLYSITYLIYGKN